VGPVSGQKGSQEKEIGPRKKTRGCLCRDFVGSNYLLDFNEPKREGILGRERFRGGYFNKGQKEIGARMG